MRVPPCTMRFSPWRRRGLTVLLRRRVLAGAPESPRAITQRFTVDTALHDEYQPCASSLMAIHRGSPCPVVRDQPVIKLQAAPYFASRPYRPHFGAPEITCGATRTYRTSMAHASLQPIVVVKSDQERHSWLRAARSPKEMGRQIACGGLHGGVGAAQVVCRFSTRYQRTQGLLGREVAGAHR